MISIQDLGIQILNHNPLPFYVFGGTEYGIKMRYVDELEKFYGHKEEHLSVLDLIGFMNTKHLIPLEPTVYVVRYDEVFASQVSEKIANRIKNSKIIGTIVCIYDNSKIITKMSKYLPDNTAIIDSVNPTFIMKYLKSDFPDLSDRLLSIAIKCSSDYGQAKNICSSMSLDIRGVSDLQDHEIEKLFGHISLSTTAQLRAGIASKNFGYLLSLIDTYDGQLDNIIYTILQVMIDLDKLLGSKYGQSDIREYAKYWKMEDIYYMFNHAYRELTRLRNLSSYDIHDSLIYLFGLLRFQDIPSLEVMDS